MEEQNAKATVEEVGALMDKNGIRFSKPVEAWKDGAPFKKFPSMSAASRETGAKVWEISRAVCGQREEAGGYAWKLLPSYLAAADGKEENESEIPQWVKNLQEDALKVEKEENYSLFALMKHALEDAGWLVSYPNGKWFLFCMEMHYLDARDICDRCPTSVFFRRYCELKLEIKRACLSAKVFDGVRHNNSQMIIEAMRMLYDIRGVEHYFPWGTKGIGPSLKDCMFITMPNRISYSETEDIPQWVQEENDKLITIAKNWVNEIGNLDLHPLEED